MIHRMLRYPAGWEWHVLQQSKQQAVRQGPLPSRKDSMKQTAVSQEEQRASKAAANKEEIEVSQEKTDELKQMFPESAAWIEECSGRKTNNFSLGEAPSSGPILYGTLMIQVSENQFDIQPLHFWLSQHKLITLHDDMRPALRLQSPEHTLKLNNCGTPQEAFFVMLSTLLETFHTGLDEFETRLGELESSMRIRNRTGLINVIIERRYELLHWNHLFVPLRELHGAAKEAFMEELTESEGYKRITYKLERIETLLKHYAHEIDTLISVDDAIASFRGNDIMKTLTIFTVMILPATVAGAIWGANFENLPLISYGWGFNGMIALIVIITILIYIWLWRKGWTGDLLNARKPQEIIAEDAPESSELLGRKRSKRSSKKTHASKKELRPTANGLSRRNRT